MAPKPRPTTCFILIVLLLLFSHKASSQSPFDEKQILLKIKKDWGNPTALSSWTAAGHPCEWTGVFCSNGSLTRIDLSFSEISAPIPASICKLGNLSYLDLSNNYIPGSFPSVLFGCSSLQQLNISNNWFVGDLPAEIDKMPQGLTHLILSYNNFTGDIPPVIGRLPAIKVLDLSNNLFNVSFPAEIGNLSTLESLKLAWNPFLPTKIPSEFGNLTSLTYLWMSGMYLEGEIPESFGNLTRLEHLDLSRNSLVGYIPAGIWMVKPLKVLYLFANKLTGEMSDTVAAKGLVQIDLSINQLTGSIPEAFGELKNLTILFLYFNNLSGKIPTSIGLLPELNDIRLFNNSIEGVLPAELGKYSKLWNLEVDDNRLTGEVPAHVCEGKALTCLIVFDNKLNGSLPESLGSCPSLLNVQVQNNRLSGDFPAGIWSAVNLSLVITSQNSLTGFLPAKLPWNLTRLEIQNNQFSGKIPSSAGGLLVFQASNNNFSGELPSSFSEMSRLQYLSLGGNRINGQIPEAISSLKSLNLLDLSRNLFSGQITEAIGSMSSLTALDLSDNDLSGMIPAQLGALRLSNLNLSNNELTGEIPSPFQNQAYEHSFLSNPGLCASESIPSLRSCTDSSRRLDKRPSVLLVLFSVLGAVLFCGVVALGVLICRQRRQWKVNNNLSDWKLTSFHKMDVSESNIMKGLSDENLVGSGGGGKVYRVISGRETVAVKKIWNARKVDSKLEKEFHAEVEVLGSIRHANIVKLLCYISGADCKLLVYEYLENGSLDRWLHRRRRGDSLPLDWQTRLQIAISAAQGLCYMHHGWFSPIVHRDVKSSNILLDADFKAKIADFGLARILSRNGEPESVSSIAGSFGYMAPECGKLRKVNEKVDVYSFGVVLLELTTGREAADGGDEEDGNLTDWAWRRYREGGPAVADALDEDIIGELPEYLEEAETVFRMGLNCTAYDPLVRPTMKQLLQVLMNLERRRNGGWSGDGACSEVTRRGGDSLLESKSNRGSRRKKVADVMEESDDSGVSCYAAGIDSLL
ncbi:hypothetical protein HPP92_008527 [Vanilla planifolia]|uniref:non-specific serine/threonine protein kinase n=1 Tax=Vanilla planifolia TaxID=51239 RepID=A0A835RI56_VANPL|nr:hypothetical protein HPP92_008527 [Vanilla planifolia]